MENVEIEGLCPECGKNPCECEGKCKCGGKCKCEGGCKCGKGGCCCCEHETIVNPDDAPVMHIIEPEPEVECPYSIEQFLGTLQQSVVEGWRYHLKTSKYSAHVALNDYYDEALEAVDGLIEGWIAAHEKPETYENVLNGEDYADPLEYFAELKKMVVCCRAKHLKDDTALESAADDIISLIDSTVYKLRELTESHVMSFANFVALH